MYVKEIGVTPMLPEEALCEQTMRRDGGCERPVLGVEHRHLGALLR